ncbi:flagellar biosynthesis protein FlhA [Ruicaihuangia caeni]
MLLIVPVPAPMLDVLIIINILLALVILLTTMFAKKPLDFSVFPSLLLAATLFRLGLNVASTRLVLGDAYAGQVIAAFGQITVGGSIVIGAVVFLILVVIQFIVVTKGAERVAEVGARFTLDAMPGKQMAIDADLNAGLITEEQARARRAEVAAEADFYGAMDGASKFVKGDAIAGIVIIIINVVGGIALGMAQRGMELGDAVNTYTLLTIGDGLVTQIPALLMAVATGMIVTRSNAENDLGTTASAQLGQSRTALQIAGAAAIVMACIPGMPILPFVLTGGLLIFTAQRIKAADAARADALEAITPPSPASDTTEELIEQMRVHPLEILLAPDLVDLVSGAGNDLLGRVKALRRKLALELGIIVPPVRTRDSVELAASEYVIRVAGVEAGRGSAPRGTVLALGDGLEGLAGTPTVEPVFGLPGRWVPNELRHSAEVAGATVIDRVSVLVTHLSRVITDNAARLLTREDVRQLTEGVKRINPAAVEELTPSPLSLAEVQRVLQNLLSEEVAITDLSRIYEAIALRARASTDPEALTEAARAAVAPAIVASHASDRTLRVIMLDPLFEQQLLESLRPSDAGSQLLVEPSRLEGFLDEVRSAVERAGSGAGDHTAAIVCAPALRPAMRRLIAAQAGGTPVLSYQEVSSASVAIETVGVVRGARPVHDQAAPAAIAVGQAGSPSGSPSGSPASVLG